MFFTSYYIDEMAKVLAANTKGLGAGVDLTMSLVISDFTPSESLTLADLQYASGNGLDPKPGAIGTAQLVWDETLGVWGFSMREALPGMLFLLSTDLAQPLTVYGYALSNETDGKLLATARFLEPKVFQKAGDYVELSSIVGWLAAPFIGGLPIPPTGEVIA